MTLWETPSERLKLLRPVEYNAPNGHFDDTAEGIPGPMPLIEEESGVLRMQVLRKALAILVLQHVFLCCCAIGGIEMHKMNLEPTMIPEYVPYVCAGTAAVSWMMMWLNAMRRPNNVLFLIVFTICLGGYMTISVVGEGKHILANLVFQFTLGWVLMLLYALPSFGGDMSLFDIKHTSGFLGYQICLVASCGLGAIAAMKIAGAKPGQINPHAMVPVAGGALWMAGALWSLRVALGYFYEEFLMAIVIYPWVYPLDQAFRFYQALWNTPAFIEFWAYLGEWNPLAEGRRQHVGHADSGDGS